MYAAQATVLSVDASRISAWCCLGIVVQSWNILFSWITPWTSSKRPQSWRMKKRWSGFVSWESLIRYPSHPLYSLQCWWCLRLHGNPSHHRVFDFGQTFHLYSDDQRSGTYASRCRSYMMTCPRNDRHSNWRCCQHDLFQNSRCHYPTALFAIFSQAYLWYAGDPYGICVHPQFFRNSLSKNQMNSWMSHLNLLKVRHQTTRKRSKWSRSLIQVFASLVFDCMVNSLKLRKDANLFFSQSL